MGRRALVPGDQEGGLRESRQAGGQAGERADYGTFAL